MTELYVAADSAEIDGLAADLDIARSSAAAALTDLAGARLRVLGVSDTPDGARGAALNAVGLAMAAVTTLETRMTDRAAALREAARGYDDAEAAAQPGPLDVVADALSSPFGFGPLSGLGFGFGLGKIIGEAAWDAVTGESWLPGSRMAELSNVLGFPRLAAVTQVLAPYFPAGAPISSFAPGGRDRQILLSPGPDLGDPAASGYADLAKRLDLVNQAAGGSEAVIDIQKIEQDGRVSWAVTVHGAKSFSPFQPFSWQETPGSFAGTGSTGEAFVVAAMEEAGIQPDEAVILTGHSFGGMAMARLAGNADFRRRFDVKGLMTYGAPVAHMPSPPGAVATMNVSAAEDAVPAISGEVGGRDGDPAPNVVEVVADLDGGGVGPVDAHDTGGYIGVVQSLEDGNYPQMLDFEEDMAPYFAGEGARVTAVTYRGSVF